MPSRATMALVPPGFHQPSVWRVEHEPEPLHPGQRHLLLARRSIYRERLYSGREGLPTMADRTNSKERVRRDRRPWDFVADAPINRYQYRNAGEYLPQKSNTSCHAH
jgi:hypothetical protein